MTNYLNDFVTAVAPALKAAFVKAAKVGAYIVLSAAIAAGYAYFDGKTGIDPFVLVAVNTFLASALKGIEVLKS